MMKYEEPEIEIIRFGDEDVIKTSGTDLPIDEGAVGGISQAFNLF